MKIFVTTNNNYIIEDGDETIYLDITGKKFEGSKEDLGEKSTQVRSNKNIFHTLSGIVNKMKARREGYSIADNIYGHDVLIDKTNFELKIDIDGELLPFSPAFAKTLKKGFEELKMAKVASFNEEYKLGDRVLLFGPTGTGKTYDFLQAVDRLMSAGEIEKSYICTITEGFEDLDFLAHIVPTATGINYSENEIVTLLREASNGTKVAILLDELNRGSKSFLNLILKLLDAVDGKNYILNNFVKNEIITIPIENVLFIATMNLGGKYVGTNALDEALLDRFNIVTEKSYNLQVEEMICANFGNFKDSVIALIEQIRSSHKDGEIRAPISTRGVKMWAEAFVNSSKSPQDLFKTFERTILNRLVSVDDYGNTNKEEIAIIIGFFEERKLGINF